MGYANMDHAVIKPESEKDGSEGATDLRRAPRFTLLIRSAKLISVQGEFVCVIRDVSTTGISMKLFHQLPQGEEQTLALQCGETYQIKRVWEREGEAGFAFVEDVDVEKFVTESGQFPKRGLRLNISISATITASLQRSVVEIHNISQQGALLQADALLALDQNLRIENRGLGDFYAKVRWREDNRYGVVFDDVMTLDDFARMAVRQQAPTLITS